MAVGNRVRARRQVNQRSNQNGRAKDGYKRLTGRRTYLSGYGTYDKCVSVRCPLVFSLSTRTI
jgi:hypothetical protein